VNELGVFAMTDKGLRGVSNPSAIFLSQHAGEVSGSCVLVTQEGTRPLLVEIQALVDAAHAPTRAVLRWDSSRTASRCCSRCCIATPGSACYDQDVFVNAVGGVRISGPAADLASCWRSFPPLPISRSPGSSRCSARWGSPARSARRRAARSA